MRIHLHGLESVDIVTYTTGSCTVRRYQCQFIMFICGSVFFFLTSVLTMFATESVSYSTVSLCLSVSSHQALQLMRQSSLLLLSFLSLLLLCRCRQCLFTIYVYIPC